MKAKTNHAIIGKSYLAEHFDSVMQYLSFGVTFSEDKRTERVTNGKLPFVRKALEYSIRYPQLIPGFENLSEYQKDENMKRNLKIFASEANETLEIIEERKGSVGYLAYAYAIAFFENVKAAADHNIASAKPVYNLFKKKFPKLAA